jgi:hypothetical protein
MSEATEIKQEAADEAAPEAPRKGHSVLAQAAGVGLAILGSSTAGNVMAGNTMPHADHGHSVARWVGVTLSMTGFLVGGVMFPFAMVPASIIGGVFQIAALIAVPALNAAGFGRPDVWGELKAEAATRRPAV